MFASPMFMCVCVSLCLFFVQAKRPHLQFELVGLQLSFLLLSVLGGAY